MFDSWMLRRSSITLSLVASAWSVVRTSEAACAIEASLVSGSDGGLNLLPSVVLRGWGRRAPRRPIRQNVDARFSISATAAEKHTRLKACPAPVTGAVPPRLVRRMLDALAVSARVDHSELVI